MKSPQKNVLSIVLLLAASAACGNDDAAPGTLTVTIYGEEFIEDTIPSDVFVDGWTVTFDKFLVVVGDISVGRAGEAPVMSMTDYLVYDLAQPSGGGGHDIFSQDVPGGPYDSVAYRIAGTGRPVAVAGNATAGDVALVNDNQLGVYAAGTAQNGTVTKTFAWGFATPTTYADCLSTAVVDGNDATTVLTIHADHLFYDDLVSEEPNVAFDLIANADTNVGNNDNDVTLAELQAVDITGQAEYQVGSLPVTELMTFIDYQISTLGHIDGEGHCDQAVRQ